MKSGLQKSVDLHSKKNAIKSRLRKDWLDTYFQKIRNEMLQAQRYEQLNIEKMQDAVDKLLDKLPGSIFDLYEMQRNNPTQFNHYLLYRLPSLPNKMIQLSLSQWSYYTHFISHLLITKGVKDSTVSELVNYAHKGILHHSLQFIEKQHKIQSEEILETVMEYLLRMGEHITEGDLIDIDMISRIIVKDIALNGGNGQKFTKCLAICYKIVCASISADNEQNIPPSVLSNLEFLKLSFINSTFFGKSLANLQNIISSTVNFASTHDQSEQIYWRKQVIQGFLRLMVNLTHFLDDNNYFLTMINLNIGQVINMLLSCDKIDSEVCILALKLLNNFLVTNIVNERMNQIILWSKIGHLAEYYQEIPSVIEEIISMLTNVIFMASDSKQTVRFYIQKGWRTLLLSHLSSSYLPAETVHNMLIAIIIFNENDPIATRRQLRQRYSDAVEEVGERFPEFKETVGTIVAGMREKCFEEELDVECG